MQGKSKKPPSQRQLRVGEELRHAIADVLMRNELHDLRLERASITVSEVRISPDLKNASVYVTPLAGGEGAQALVDHLNELAAAVRREVNRKIILKYSPKLFFKLDRSFDVAGRINQLLQDPRVIKDILPPTDEDNG